MKQQPSQIEAQWEVALHCKCPKCGEFVNLLGEPDFWDGRGWLGIPEHGTEQSNNLEVNCPDCNHAFEVCCVW
jgi:phage FluMu protein Com